jgi:hypothetical protein
MTKLINNIYENEEWHKDFNEVTMPALKRVPYNSAMPIEQPPSTHIQQRQSVIRTLTRRFERKIEDILGDQFRFRREKGTRAAIGMLRTISG